MNTLTQLLAAALLVVPVSLLSACTPAPPASTVASSDAGAFETAPGADAKNSAPLTLAGSWAKAGETGGMTGVFGTLTNNSEQDIVISSVSSDDTEMIELHEVTPDGVMQKIQGDVVVPGNGTFELAPGANHIMLMGLKKDLLAGDEVTFTLHFTSIDGKKFASEFVALVKDYAGANENYASGDHEGESSDAH